MTTPAENAWRQASKWRKKAREKRKLNQRDIKFLKSDKATMSKKLLALLAVVEKNLKDPKAPQKLDKILKKFEAEQAKASQHILGKIRHKDTSEKDREKLEERWRQWSNTWFALFDLRWRLWDALKFDAAAKMQDELGDALEEFAE
jgi:hypothetical protein